MKLAISPINWNNDDLPDLGSNYSFEQILSEMKEAGYKGCEIGHCFPKDADVLRARLESCGIQACNQWFDFTLTIEDFETVRRRFEIQLEYLDLLGADVIGGCEVGRYNFDQSLVDPDCKISLSDEEWENLIAGLNELGRISADRGIQLAYHPHIGTATQYDFEISRIFDFTDDGFVYYNYDPAHLILAGIDPLVSMKKYGSRVAHVHLKDVRSVIFDRSKKMKWSFRECVRNNLFGVPGIDGGLVDFDSILSELKSIGYDRWLVVEADQDPECYDPLQQALLAKGYLKSRID